MGALQLPSDPPVRRILAQRLVGGLAVSALFSLAGLLWAAAVSCLALGYAVWLDVAPLIWIAMPGFAAGAALLPLPPALVRTRLRLATTAGTVATIGAVFHRMLALSDYGRGATFDRDVAPFGWRALFRVTGELQPGSLLASELAAVVFAIPLAWLLQPALASAARIRRSPA